MFSPFHVKVRILAIDVSYCFLPALTKIWILVVVVSLHEACLVSGRSEFSVGSLALSLVKMMQLLQMRKCKEPSEEKALSTQYCNLSALVLYSQNQIVPSPTDKQDKVEREIMVLNRDDVFSVPQ